MSNLSGLLNGSVLILAPHMDDEILGCGGTMALHSDRRRVFVAYATDGRRLPGMKDAGPGKVNGRDLAEIRADESRAALGVLGIPPENARFLGFPAGDLRVRRYDLVMAIERLVEEIRPTHVFVPFRYDQHPDHLILNNVSREALAHSVHSATLLEYFVYFKLRMLAGGDIRKLIRPEYLQTVDISPASELKRKALNCFESQVKIFFPGQKNPVFSTGLLDEFSRGPELFMQWPGSVSSREVFTMSPDWVRFVHAVEPPLKRNKDKLLMALGIK